MLIDLWIETVTAAKPPADPTLAAWAAPPSAASGAMPTVRMLMPPTSASWPAAACVPPAGMPPLPGANAIPSPPARGPAPPPELPYFTRGGYVICRICNLATLYCKGHTPAPGSAAKDGDCDSTLDERIAECQGK